MERAMVDMAGRKRHPVTPAHRAPRGLRGNAAHRAEPAHRENRPDRADRSGRAHRPGMIVGRVVACVVSAAVLATAGTAWSMNVVGTSDAVTAAGNVGVVSVPNAADATGAGKAPTAALPVRGTPAGGPSAPAGGADVPAIGAENILVVGADARTDAQGNPLTPAQQKLIGVTLDGGGVNTDTLLIIHIPAGGGAATGISIPRDTWMFPSVVDAPGVTGPDQYGNQVHYQPGKINGFYSTAKYYDQQYLAGKGVTGAALERESNDAGATMLVKIVQQFTGIKINHFVFVNLISFYLLSQAIGGVPVCLLHPVHDRQSGADFPAGHFDVQGASALAFVRQRHGLPGGDLDRINRQHEFLESAANKILSAGTLTNPARLLALVDAARRSLTLDSGFDLMTFAEQMHGLVAGAIHFLTLPTTDATQITTTSALQADPTQVRAIFARLAADEPIGAAASTQTHSASPAPVPTTTSTSMTTFSAAAASTSSSASSGFQVPCIN